MNLNELFPEQKKLDEHIIQEHKLQGKDLSKKKAVSLLTELFECVNEARFFKFWSEDQSPKTKVLDSETWHELGCPTSEEELEKIDESNWRNPLLEEYIDSIHFTLSNANDYGYHEHEYKDPGSYDLNNLVLGIAQLIATLPYVRKEDKHKNIEILFNYLIKLGYMFGFNEETVKQAYYEKNKVNHQRQKNGY
ncbi:dUTP diphosphatase [Evansella clarkii]|uniref:dUTP diphosphatase n=1 Tax=Evansella clarkii TaxID=79879 RepID=UPI0009961480|nr:dUTP diphosphatase [Evansella clarkii]